MLGFFLQAISDLELFKTPYVFFNTHASLTEGGDLKIKIMLIRVR